MPRQKVNIDLLNERALLSTPVCDLKLQMKGSMVILIINATDVKASKNRNRPGRSMPHKDSQMRGSLVTGY